VLNATNIQPYLRLCLSTTIASNCGPPLSRLVVIFARHVRANGRSQTTRPWHNRTRYVVKSSTATRKYVESVVAKSHPDRVVAYDVTFVGMVLPGDEFKVTSVCAMVI